MEHRYFLSGIQEQYLVFMKMNWTYVKLLLEAYFAGIASNLAPFCGKNINIRKWLIKHN